MDLTLDSSVYKKVRKIYLERKGLIHCSWCMYHRNENSPTKIVRCWKNNGKKTRQYEYELSKNKRLERTRRQRCARWFINIGGLK